MTASPLRPSTATSHALTVAAALGAAREAGLVRLLDDGPIGIDALAGRTESHPRGVRLVMDGLVAAGIVDSSGQGYRWHPSSAADDLEQLWLGMTHLLSTGSAPISVDEPDVAGRLYPPVVTAIARHAEPAAERVSTLVESNARVLDVGSGAAPFGIAAAGAGGVVTLLDLPEVVDVGATRARDLGLAVSTIAGDVFDTSLDPRLASSFDVVVIGGFCRLFDAGRVERLLQRAAGWLTPEGRLVIVDAVDSFEARQRGIGIYALNLATRTRGGGIHSFASFARWLERAGFAHLELIACELVETSIISARLVNQEGQPS